MAASLAAGWLLPAAPARAATGINAQINFQGRLLNSSDVPMPDGTYNVEFKIYKDGDGQTAGDTTGSPAGTLLWTEDHLNASSQGVQLFNGYFSVQLGSVTSLSSVDFNSDTLWISLNFGTTAASCTPFSNCGGDGEMIPMKRLSANAYAMNSQLLGGLSSAQFLQLAQGVQTDSSTANASIFVNKTGSTANILDLQRAGNDVMVLNNAGQVLFRPQTDAQTALQVQKAGTTTTVFTVDTSNGRIGIGTATPAFAVDAVGDINASSSLKVATATVCTSSGCLGDPTKVIVNGTSVQASANFYIRSAAISSVAAIIEGANGQTADLLRLNGFNGTTGTTVAKFDAAGNLVVSATGNSSFAGNLGLANTGPGNRLSVNIPGTADAAAQALIATGGTNSKGLVIQGVSGQSASLLGLQDNSGNVVAKFGGAGQLTLGTLGALAGGASPVAGSLVFGDGSTTGRILTLQAGTLASINQSITLPDESGTICLRNSSNCGFVSGSGGANFINNGTSVQNAANYYIRSNGDTVTGILEGSNGQTSDLLRLNTYNGSSSTTVAKFTAGGSLSITNSSSSALAVNNSSGQKVLSVDASAQQAILGQSSAVNGALVFKNSSGTNGITINSTKANASYTLTLPESAPAAGLCIETSNASATQLVFASCANNNASIQQVAEWDANNTNTVTVSPSSIGDEIVLTTQIPTSGVTVTGISGGGVSTWNKAVVSAGNGTVNRVEMWVGTVTATGSSAITVTYSAAPGAEEITATEFTAAGVNASTSWGIESSSSQLNSVASSTVTFPGMTAINGSELYVGYGQVQNPPATGGSTSGFNYLVTSTQHNVITYNTSLAANTSYQPTATQSSAGQSNTVSAVLTAFVTSTSINNTTTLQRANFYVQAATGASVAGVLQAAATGTADIMDLRNPSAVNVMTVGYTGATVFKNSTDSAQAFQVQNTGGQNLFTVNTAANTVSLGTSGALDGSLSFNDKTDSNSITLKAPDAVAASYTLSLPSNTPTAGLCLGTSPSNATQLIFASCATQVSAAAITYVNQWSASGTSLTTLADAPASNGNLLILYSHAANNVAITSISGGGVTNWTKVTSNTNTTGQGNNEMWRGVVTGTGAGTITVTYSGAAGTNEIVAQEYTMGGAGGTWAVDTSGTAINSGSQTTINYPSLTPANSSELYTGYAWGQNTMSAGSTTGFTYVATGGGKYTAYNTSVTGGTVQQPTATQSVAGNYNSIAALIQAYAGTSVIVNSTATQQANFAVQAATSGTVAGMLQGASSGTADIFEAKDSTGNNVAAINAASGLTLGTAGTLGGQLVFAAASNTNTVTINAPAAPGTSYQLTLPSGAPAAGQCLAAGAANPSQLIFSSCANQVTSVAISFVNNWKTSGNAVTTLSVSPANVGDLMIFISSPNSATSIASLSGGGVSGWTKITGITNGSGSATSSIEMWRGVVTTAGASTITASFNGPTGNPNELAAMEFSTGSSTGSWVVDSSNAQYNAANSTTVTFPSLTPQSAKDLYVGYASAQSAQSAGTSSGFTYLPGNLTSRQGLYNTGVSATTQPTATQTTSGTSITVGALVAAYSSSSVVANSTITQQANFNVQAATPGSVAGVLQAYPTGSGDILNILDGQGNLVDSVGATGNFLVKPSAGSASALQVQTSLGVNVLSADTNSKLVVVGAGATGETAPSLLVLDNQTGSSADPTALNGAMYYNATTHEFRCGVDGGWQNCTGLLYVNTSSSAVNSNCSNNCQAFSTAAAIPANYCQTGRVIKLHATGFFSSQATASNLQFGVYYGTSNTTASSDTLLGTASPAASVTGASSNYFELNFNILCFSTSSMQAGGILSVQTGSSGAGLTGLPMGTSSGTTVVTSSAQNLYIFPIWDTAATANSATLTQFEVSGL